MAKVVFCSSDTGLVVPVMVDESCRGQLILNWGVKDPVPGWVRIDWQTTSAIPLLEGALKRLSPKSQELATLYACSLSISRLIEEKVFEVRADDGGPAYKPDWMEPPRIPDGMFQAGTALEAVMRAAMRLPSSPMVEPSPLDEFRMFFRNLYKKTAHGGSDRIRAAVIAGWELLAEIAEPGTVSADPELDGAGVNLGVRVLKTVAKKETLPLDRVHHSLAVEQLVDTFTTQKDMDRMRDKLRAAEERLKRRVVVTNLDDPTGDDIAQDA